TKNANVLILRSQSDFLRVNYIPRPSRVLRYPFSRVLNRRTRNAPAYPAHPPKVFQVRIAFAYKSCDISGFSH
ncbi:hypothetical protein, partial [uncultured Fibrobacter sp.]|uniref:hypothetical protein n=1 Tax=uncultured Fibrobacter sp. TaxID=261512 RepID=UPI002593A72E